MKKMWKKATLNTEIQFKDFLNCDDNLLTTARMTTQEICSAVNKQDKAAQSEQRVSNVWPIPSYGKAVSEATLFFRRDDASLAWLDQPTRELLFHQPRSTKEMSVSDYFKK